MPEAIPKGRNRDGGGGCQDTDLGTVACGMWGFQRGR